MGYYGAKIGNYQISVHDSFHDYVKKNKPLEYYQKYKIKAELTNFKTEEKEEIEFPLLMFGKAVLIKKTYKFEFDFDLLKILYDFLIKRRATFLGRVVNALFVGDRYDRKYESCYLQTEIGSEEMIFSNKNKKLHTIRSFEDVVWIRKFNLEFEQEN